VPFEVRIIADSLAPCGARLTTFALTYPRFIHSELMTHREFSRNAASSRAIPISKVIQQVLEDPAMPVRWGRNKTGMQADEDVDDDTQRLCEAAWVLASHCAVEGAETLSKFGLHKQIANRLLEPWVWMTTIISSTDYANFFKLRCHKDAQPEFQHLASLMRDAYILNPVRKLAENEWHLPFLHVEDNQLSLADKIRVCVGRCARVSYLTHDGNRDPQADIQLCDRLIASGHWSPLEHCAAAQSAMTRSGNFVGWKQFRKQFEEEYASSYRTATDQL
jgi:thymidylate synthase ThyX